MGKKLMQENGLHQKESNGAGLRKEAERLFHHQIVERIEANQIPDSLVLNFDQTPSKYVLVSTATLAKRNSKQVSIKGLDDKRSSTANFTITQDGKFLGMHVIYGGKTNQSLPRYQFPKWFSHSVKKKHYSNEKKSMIEEIVLAYVNKGRLKVNRPNQVVLIIFDALRGQITDDVLKLFKQNHIDTVFVPANMNGILRPLDLTVIGFAKFCEKKFNH